MRRRSVLLLLAGTLWVLGSALVPGAAGAAGAAPTQGSTYAVQADAQAPNSEPWDFLRFFPHAITVHQGDVIDTAWGGTDAPHTSSFVDTSDPETWRAQNQCDGCAYAPFEPDVLAGGDDDELVVNPTVLNPTSVTCGTEAAPCSFDGSSVVTSGLLFSNPAAEPSFYVQVDAPVGHYSLLCLLHPGMEIPVTVRPPDKPIPSPDAVAQRLQHDLTVSQTVDGPAADAQAQEVSSQEIGHGRIDWTLNAGGFQNQVTANEYIDAGLTVHVGDQVTFQGQNEIHTATLPFSSVDTVPFLLTQCEVPGPDIPANDPSDCADPSEFQVALNNRAIDPTASNLLINPNRFRNSGLLGAPGTYTFVAAAPGTYTVVCLVHGPSMTTTITVEGN
jgi:plastocyanin